MRGIPRPADRVLRNLWYEGLVLHSPVLRDFFFTKVEQKGKNKGRRVKRDGDVVAVDYFAAGSSSWLYTSSDLPPYLRRNKERMDRSWPTLAMTGSNTRVTRVGHRSFCCRRSVKSGSSLLRR